MARRQSTSNARARRNSASAPVGARHRGRDRADARPLSLRKLSAADRRLAISGIVSVLEDGRGRLSNAQSVLGCLHVALLHADDVGIKEDPGYAIAAGIALSLVREVVEHLDSARLQPFVDALDRRLPSKAEADGRA